MSKHSKNKNLNMEAIPKLRLDIWCPFKDGMIRVIDFNGKNIILNKQASSIWRLIDGKRKVCDIIEEVIKKEVAENKVVKITQNDILKFIRYILSRKWISLGILSTWNNFALSSSETDKPL